MLEKLGTEVQHLIAAMQGNMLFALKILALLWIIQIINVIMQYRLNVFGIVPRTGYGLPGIIFSPLLHGNFNHLFFNSIPLFVLADLVLIHGRLTFYYVTASIVIISGFLTWVFGQRGTHVGASSVIMGYFGFLIAKAYFQFNATTVILAGICLYYFGGLVLSLFPGAEKNVSWEGHVFGFGAGIFVAFQLPKIISIFHLII